MAFYCNGKKGFCDCAILCADCKYFDHSGGKKLQTNADRIRAMSDDELANIMAGTPICKERYMDCIKDGLDCEACLLEWLKRPAEGE